MKIGILSDTHIDRIEKIPKWINKYFRNVDLILHCGDIENPEVLEYLKNEAPVYAVRGNCDRKLQELPLSRSIKIENTLITFAHKPADARKALRNNSKVMIYGHTHISLINQEEKLLVINPGSPTLPRGGLPPSIAILEINNDSIKGELKND